MCLLFFFPCVALNFYFVNSMKCGENMQVGNRVSSCSLHRTTASIKLQCNRLLIVSVLLLFVVLVGVSYNLCEQSFVFVEAKR